MTMIGLLNTTEYLRNAAQKWFNSQFHNPACKVEEKFSSAIKWSPSLQFLINSHHLVIVEASEVVYPEIFRLRGSEIINEEVPISIYCVCPEEVFLTKPGQLQARDLASHGFGLLTVDDAGVVTRRQNAAPLAQRIGRGEFNSEISGLPQKVRTRLAESFEKYEAHPVAGVQDITDVAEGFVLRAGQDAVKAGHLQANQAKPGKSAETLKNLEAVPQAGNVAAQIGLMKYYISEYRNTSHHFPRDKKKAYKKYRDCRYGFVSGIRTIKAFQDAMKSIGLSGKMPPI